MSTSMMVLAGPGGVLATTTGAKTVVDAAPVWDLPGENAITDAVAGKYAAAGHACHRAMRAVLAACAPGESVAALCRLGNTIIDSLVRVLVMVYVMV
jgi:hypothetical protein